MTNYSGIVRELINEALTDDEVRTLCFDHFHQVYDSLSAAMSRTECIRRLVEWCYRHRQIELLLDNIKVLNPSIYETYTPQLEQTEYKYPPELPEMATPHLYPCMMHPLPPAPTFVGRRRELDALQQFWTKGNPGVISLIGLGGAGKTAIVAEFLNRVTTNVEDQPNGLFVWSFYVNQDINEFLEVAYNYFSGGKTAHGSGMGILYLLLDLLGRSINRYLIVMDGLERVQRPQSDLSGAFGDLTDPLLSQIVSRMAVGLGNSKCIITSRFPLPRLNPWMGKSYFSLDIDQLHLEDARSLLRRHHIKGDDVTLDTLINDYGSHALTLDHLGGYLSEYCNCDPSCATMLPEPQIESIELQERRLAKVLNAYEKALSKNELALLARLCVFRFGITTERLHSVFSTIDNPLIAGPLKGLTVKDFHNNMKHLAGLHLISIRSNGEYTAHPAIRDHFYRSFADPKIVHQAVRRHYISLVGPPGTAQPSDNDTIDLLEELLYHTLQTGDVSEAREIYFQRLGSYLHLSWNLGQYSRCIRILNEFPKCPDPAGLVWCYRAVGDLDAALSLIDRDDTWWLGMIGCLRGRIKEVTNLLALNRQDPILAISQFLTGSVGITALETIPIWFGLPISPAECYLQAGMVDKAREFVEFFLRLLKRSPKSFNWNDEIARYDLISAEIELRSGNTEKCRKLLEKATQWIVQSGSQEHLCLLHMGKARLAISEGQFHLSEDMLNAGLYIAEQCGFGLYHIELLIEKAKLFLIVGRTDDALRSAKAALNGILKSTCSPAPESCLDENKLLLLGANHPKCQFVWGSAKAGYFYAQSLFMVGKKDEAKKMLDATVALQKRINDPEKSMTEKLLLEYY